MFEPLKDLIGDHSEKLYELLERIDANIDHMVNDVVSEVTYDQYTTRSSRAIVGEDGTAIIELSPSEGFSWRVERVALTASEEGNCALYNGSVAPENLVDAFREPKIISDRGKYFIPRGSSLTIHFYEQEPGHVCTVNIQAEQLIPVVKVARSVSGSQSEFIDPAPNRPVVPNGAPLVEQMTS